MNPHNVEESNDNQNSQTYQPLENIGRPIVIVPWKILDAQLLLFLDLWDLVYLK